jgi:hypothetical protein
MTQHDRPEAPTTEEDDPPEDTDLIIRILEELCDGWR